MSVNRENIVWQSKDGSWSRGFYDYYDVQPRDGEDFDYEWDVEYTDSLSWVSTGHPSKESAERSWQGANPGGQEELSYDEEYKAEIDKLDDEAAKTYLANKHGGDYALGYSRGTYYQGPAKQRKPAAVAKDFYSEKMKATRYKYEGYGNEPHPLLPTWEKELEAAGDAEGVAEARESYRKDLESFIADKEDRSRRFGGFTSSPEQRARNYRQSEMLQKLKAEARELRQPPKPTAPEKSTSVDSPSSSQTATSSTSKSNGTYGQYHINPSTGRPNKCYASKKPCPFGGGDSHYESKTEARAGYEKKMSESTIPAAQKR